MKTKFNLFERVAGLFVLTALIGSLAVAISVAYKKGWFSARIPLTGIFQSAEGIHAGTKIQMAGLRAGAVTNVELQADNSIKVSFELMEKFFKKVKSDSKIRIVRPFIIGEKVIQVTVGGQEASSVSRGAELPVEASVDLMDLVSGGKLGRYFSSFSQVAENLGILVEAFSDKERFTALISVLDEINPLVKNLNSMSRGVVLVTDQLAYERRIGRLVDTMATLTDEVHNHMPEIKKNAPTLISSVNQSMQNLAVLTEEMKKILPTLGAVAPDLPVTARRMIEAVDEAVVVLKALQKSWFIRSSVAEVREKEAEREKKEGQPQSKERMPASEQK